MLRLIIAMALIFAALYYYLQDKKEQQVAGEQQKEMIETAQMAKQLTEKAAAIDSQRSDEARDAAMGLDTGAPDDGSN